MQSMVMNLVRLRGDARVDPRLARLYESTVAVSAAVRQPSVVGVEGNGVANVNRVPDAALAVILVTSLD